MGVKIEYTAEEIEPMRRLDPFFLQGTSSANDTFIYLSGESHHHTMHGPRSSQ